MNKTFKLETLEVSMVLEQIAAGYTPTEAEFEVIAKRRACGRSRLQDRSAHGVSQPIAAG